VSGRKRRTGRLGDLDLEPGSQSRPGASLNNAEVTRAEGASVPEEVGTAKVVRQPAKPHERRKPKLN
jgi:hypothetical protein